MPRIMNVALIALASLSVPACRTAGDAPPRLLGAQLYTVRDDMAHDPLGTIDRVGALGFSSVELAGLHGIAPEDLCGRVERARMRVAASHVDWRLLRDDPAQAIAQTGAVCSDTIILAWLPEEERRTLAQWRWWIGHLNAVAAMARLQGVTVAYHAHDFEFRAIDGVRPIDLLISELSPAVGFELDTYWLAKAGADPLEFLRAHPGRVTHLHLKDIDEEGAMADVGSGLLDFAALLAEARRLGVRHLIVERDDAADPWASLAASLDYLRTMPLQQ